MSHIRITRHDNFDKSLAKVNMFDVQYNTGDIVFFRHNAPMWTYGDNGINIKFHIVKNILKTINYMFDPYFSHSGIIIKLNGDPYVFHLTADYQYCSLTERWVIGSPALVSLHDIMKYPGFVYHVPYRLKKTVDAKWLNSFYDNRLVGNPLKAISVSGLGIGQYSHNKMACTCLVKMVMVKLGIINTNGCAAYPKLSDIFNIIQKDKNYGSMVFLKTGLYLALNEKQTN
jgi:hypothetical protein